MKTLVCFISGALAFGMLSLGIGYAAWDQEALIQGGAAFGLTFVPAALTLAWVVFSYRTTPDMQLLASLGGSGVRMAVALGGGMMLTNAQPASFDSPFWCWLVLFYLVLLGYEITLLVRGQPKVDRPPQS